MLFFELDLKKIKTATIQDVQRIAFEVWTSLREEVPKDTKTLMRSIRKPANVSDKGNIISTYIQITQPYAEYQSKESLFHLGIPAKSISQVGKGTFANKMKILTSRISREKGKKAEKIAQVIDRMRSRIKHTYEYGKAYRMLRKSGGLIKYKTMFIDIAMDKIKIDNFIQINRVLSGL